LIVDCRSALGGTANEDSITEVSVERERMIYLGDARRLHFIGIGGIGMSGIAEILLEDGYEVSGSDLQDGPILDMLRNLGARISIGHRSSNIQNAQAIVYSTAVTPDNPELAAARQASIPIVHRSDLLFELMRRKITVTIAGTHGKTTTTSMISLLLQVARLDPTMVIGARLKAIGSNARAGKGDYLVAEADESDRSFLKYRPVYAVVTNIDRDHMDTYRDLADIQNAFVEHMNSIPFYGCVIACLDDPNLRTLLGQVNGAVVTYGFHTEAQVQIRDPEYAGFQSSYSCYHKGELLGRVELHVPGWHNLSNSAAAVALGLQLKIPFPTIQQALKTFRGAERRMEWKGEKGQVWVIDDYGHHPTEIRATLEACRLTGRRIVVVFQPHRYTRTRDLMNELGTCFENAHRLYLMDIYSAGEKPIEGVTAVKLAEEIGRHRQVEYVADRTALLQLLGAELVPGDLLLTLGAGNVWTIGEDFLEQQEGQ
jgi:UDP-N-acetylmuramate--alanine ligase